MAQKLVLTETKTSIILEIPKALLSKGRDSFSEAEVLELAAQAEMEFKEGKAKTFRSIKELLASSYGQ